MDETLTDLFEQWLNAFGNTQAVTGEKETIAVFALATIESRIAATPAEWSHGLVLKLGLDRFLNEHADAAGEQAVSAYADLVRLTGYNPAAEIFSRLERVPARTD